MKKFVIFLSITLTLGTVFYTIYKTQHHGAFHCDAQVISHLINDADNKIEINTNVVIVFSSSTQGVMLFSGSVEYEGKKYTLNRNTYFSIAPSELKEVRKVSITNENIKPKDNTPNELWRNRILPEIPGIAYYSEVKKLNNNAILVKTLTNPLLVCLRQ